MDTLTKMKPDQVHAVMNGIAKCLIASRESPTKAFKPALPVNRPASSRSDHFRDAAKKVHVPPVVITPSPSRTSIRVPQTTGWKDPQHALVLDAPQKITRPHVSEDTAERRRLLEHRAARLASEANHVADAPAVQHETRPRERPADVMQINPRRLPCGESEESKTFIDKLAGVRA